MYVLRTPARSVAGYCAAWFVLDEVHINNIAVRPELRGRGFGSALLARVLEEGRRGWRHRAPRWRCGARMTMRGGCTSDSDFASPACGATTTPNPVEDALVLWREAATDRAAQDRRRSEP